MIDRRSMDNLMRDFVTHVESAIERGEFADKEHAARMMLEHLVPASIVADVLRRTWGVTCTHPQ